MIGHQFSYLPPQSKLFPLYRETNGEIETDQ